MCGSVQQIQSKRGRSITSQSSSRVVALKKRWCPKCLLLYVRTLVELQTKVVFFNVYDSDFYQLNLPYLCSLTKIWFIITAIRTWFDAIKLQILIVFLS